MLTTTKPGAPAPILPAALSSALTSAAPGSEQVRHLLFGSPQAIRLTIAQLHQLGYANATDWSRPISTGRPNEVMVILTKRVSAE